MTQTQQIRAHLLKHHSITPLEALRKYKVFRLAARVNELRKAHFDVQTQIVSRGGKKFAKYTVAQ